MPQYTQPNVAPDWAEGSGALVSQPTPSQQASGFTLNQRPSASTVNWLFQCIGRSLRFLSQGVNAVLVGANAEPSYRLIGGGMWSWSASTGVLAWSDTAYISTPGLADSANTIAAGSVTLAAGQVAYVASNTPFSSTGNTTSGSNQVTNLAYESGIVVGASVTGTGIAAGTTVSAISTSDSSITLSANATATGSTVPLTFATTGNLSVQAVNVASFTPSSNAVVIARCIAGTPNVVHVGVNSGQMRLSDGEAKSLLGNGYITTMRATAGAAIAAHQPVYISPGSADSRTAGYAYPLDVSTSGTPTRAAFAGLATTAAAAGTAVEIVMAGKVPGFGTLVPGQTYYASPTAPASLQATAPTTSGQFVVPVGAAASADVLVVTPIPSPVVQAIGSTTAFSGVVTAFRFTSTYGSPSYYSLGALGGPRQTTRRNFQNAYYNSSTSAFLNADAVFTAINSVTLRGVSIAFANLTSSSATYTMQVIKNGSIVFTQIYNESAAMSEIGVNVPLVQNDQVLVAITHSASSQTNAVISCGLYVAAN